MEGVTLEGYFAAFESSAASPSQFVVQHPVGSLVALRAVARLPRLVCEPSATPAGRSVRSSLTSRRSGLTVGQLGVGVLDVSAGVPAYLRGRSRQALRTGVNTARAAGVVNRALRHDEVTRFRPVLAPALHERGLLVPADELFQSWWGAVAPDGEVLCVSVCTPDRNWAVLERHIAVTAGPLRSASRYFLHLGVVEHLVSRGVRFLVDPTQPHALPAGLQHYQRRLGFEAAASAWLSPAPDGSPDSRRPPERGLAHPGV